jgi:acyl-CoA thioesterase
MKMDNTFVASLLTGAMASFGIERKSANQQKKTPPKVEPPVKTPPTK